MTDIWVEFVNIVLPGIDAPISENTIDAMWGWSCAESLPYDPRHINNPLDTTWAMPGATPWNTFGNNEHVWIYPTIQEGAQATINTLLQPGEFPTILSNLRNSVPRSQWGNACGDLGRWGTGCGWLNTIYGGMPSMHTTDDIYNLLDAVNVTTLGRMEKEILANGTAIAGLVTQLNTIETDIKAIPTTGGSVDLTPVLTAITALRADLDALKLSGTWTLGSLAGGNLTLNKV